jgi:hypothetical protein
MAPTETGGAVGTRATTTARATPDGDIAIRLVAEGTGRRFVRVLRATSGTVLAVIEQRAAIGRCVPLGLAQGAPLVVPFFEAGRGVLSTRIDPTRGGLHWSSHWAPTPAIVTSTFDTGHGLGATFDDGTVSVLDDDAPSWRSVDRGPTSYRSDADGNVALWTWGGGSGGDLIRGSVGGAPASTMVDGDVDAHVVAISKEHIVWIGTRGPRARFGEYESAQLFFAPRAAPRAPEGHLQARAGPVLPANRGLADLVTKGEHAATIGCSGATPETCDLYLARLASESLIRRPPRVGTLYRGVLAISEAEVLLGESDLGAPPQRLDRLVRLKLSPAASSR